MLLIQVATSAANLAPAVAAPALLSPLGLSPVAVGFYVALLYASAMVSAQLGPMLVRRWGPVRTSQWALTVSAVGLVLVGIPQVGVAAVGTCLVGVGCGPVVPAGADMLVRATPPGRVALAFSIRQTGVPLGGVLAGLLVPPVSLAWGGQGAMIAAAGFCVIVALAAQGLRPHFDNRTDPLSAWPSLSSMAQPIRTVLDEPRLRGAVLGSTLYAAMQVCVASYLVVYLTRDLGWNVAVAGLGLAVAQIGGALGRVAWGALADGPAQYDGTMRLLIGAMALSGFAMVLLPQGQETLPALLLLGLLGASAIGWNGVFFARLSQLAPHGQMAEAVAGGVFFNYLGVVIGPAIFGVAAAGLGSHGWAYALFSVPLAVLCVALWRAPTDGARRAA
ncbi:MFS transporter [Hydrogenophaga sp. BPS33]|uniref:MFS transporter n=1 Tax=Hydrogenophaga sp. BPS33 TaxID=2651974 RepID=UPI00135C344A|nr:MFS transporter [Hydrogenophaga sp. BPS33]